MVEDCRLRDWPTYSFLSGPWENATDPTIVARDPEGGDPWILATIKRVHRPDLLYHLCYMANLQIEGPVPVEEESEPTAEPVMHPDAEQRAKAFWDHMQLSSRNAPDPWEQMNRDARARIIAAISAALSLSPADGRVE